MIQILSIISTFSIRTSRGTSRGISNSTTQFYFRDFHCLPFFTTEIFYFTLVYGQLVPSQP